MCVCMQDSGYAELLYNFDWYNLPIKHQKDIWLLINRKQHGNTITVGPLGNINRELFKDVMIHQFMRILVLGKYATIYTRLFFLSDLAKDLFLHHVSPQYDQKISTVNVFTFLFV